MVAASPLGLIAPADGDAFLISRMNLAPGCARTVVRLRFVGDAPARNAAMSTRAKRAWSSSRFEAAICPSTPAGSATARLHEIVEHGSRPPRSHRLHGEADTLLEARDLARRHEQGTRVQSDDRNVGGATDAGEDIAQPTRILLRRAARDLAQRHPFDARLLGRDFKLLELAP